MRKLLTLSAVIAVFSALALAESFTGRLVDASCFDQQKSATSCDPTATTTAFALLVSDKAVKLDEAGNAKASEALKSRADRAADPSKPASAQVMAKITGKQDGDTIKVEAIEVQ